MYSYTTADRDEFMEQFDDALLGADVDAFLRSAVGKYILEQAYRQERDALTELKVVDPWDTKRIAKLQFLVREATSAVRWLMDQYQAGMQAIANLETLERGARYE